METYTKSGRLTSYGLACGKVESKIIAGSKYGSFTEKTKVELYHEGSVYHVKVMANGRRLSWETFETLGEARKHYNSIKAPGSKGRSTYRNGDEITLTFTGCDGCLPSMINGVFCHEAGCPDSWKDKKKACFQCGCDFYPQDRCDLVCQDCMEQ